MGRFICGKCAAQYRYFEDFAEHGRVGCVVPQGAGPTWSVKEPAEEAPQEEGQEARGDMDAPPRPQEQEEGGE